MNRRLALLGTFLLALTAMPVSAQEMPRIIPVLASSELAQGPNRFLFSLTDPAGALLAVCLLGHFFVFASAPEHLVMHQCAVGTAQDRLLQQLEVVAVQRVDNQCAPGAHAARRVFLALGQRGLSLRQPPRGGGQLLGLAEEIGEEIGFQLDEAKFVKTVGFGGPPAGGGSGPPAGGGGGPPAGGGGGPPAGGGGGPPVG